MAELRVYGGDGGERVVPLEDSDVSFGRSDECDVVLDEQRASRRHCTFKPRRGGWRVVDEGSSNGTFLGEKPVLSARLQPGDELEIGQTVIVFQDDASLQSTPRTRKTRTRRPPWGLLAVPIVLAGAAWAGLDAFEAKAKSDADKHWARAARSVVDRTALAVSADESRAGDRVADLKAFIAGLPAEPAAQEARQIARSALDSGPGDVPDGAGMDAGAWRSDLVTVEGSWEHTTRAEKRSRLRDLLGRYVDSADAAAAIRGMLVRVRDETEQNATADRDRTFAAARAAAAEGRLGEAVDAWNGWLLRAPEVSVQDERVVTNELEELLELARDASSIALDRGDKLLLEGKPDAARDHVSQAAVRLRGTGYDTWLRAHGARFGLLESGGGGGATVVAVERRGVDTTAQRKLALRALSSAEDLARLRRFQQAADRLSEAIPKVDDEGLRGDLEARLEDLRGEARLLASIIQQVQERPRDFGSLKLTDGTWKIFGATHDGLLIEKNGASETRALGELPAFVLGHLCRKATIATPDDALAAALILWDIGDREGYVEFMRQALAEEDDTKRLEISAVHARLNGFHMPSTGYVPHPETDGGVITWGEWDAIRNKERIAEYTAQLEKIITNIENSKQAKSIERVRAAYADLEAARQHALELIFDEVKYFYPYRDRMKEYLPVKKEVADRVKLVVEAWENAARAKPETDSKIEKWIADGENLCIEIDYYGGFSGELWKRAERVTMYLGHDLTVRNFFENEADLDLLQYNDEVMAENAAMDTVATKNEREQVRITNDYRIMFGHRPAVKINDELTLAARGHSEDMERLGFFDHFSPVPGKRSPGDRTKKAGYEGMGVSENIHQGSGSPQGAHDSWAGSSGHHRNLLMESWLEMGTGQSGSRWTQNFGFRDIYRD